LSGIYVIDIHVQASVNALSAVCWQDFALPGVLAGRSVRQITGGALESPLDK
jgi:hypothetical protein